MDITNTISKKSNSESKTRQRIGKYLERMIGASVFEREDWNLIKSFKRPIGWRPKNYERALLAFIWGFSKAIQGETDYKHYLDELQSIKGHEFSRNYFKRPEQLEIWILEVRAAFQMFAKNYDEAILLMEEATKIEENLPSPSGPPRIIKPTYEWLGEILLQANKPEEAAKQFEISLSRHPKRARSLIGAARAAVRQNKPIEASKKYSQFISIWKHADLDLPEFKEAESYLKQ